MLMTRGTVRLRVALRRLRVLALVVTFPAHWGQMKRIAPFLSGLLMGAHRYLARSAYQSARSSPVRPSGATHRCSGIHFGKRVPQLRSSVCSLL